MAKPLISVIIPAYDVSRYIAETINSVLQQTLEPCEIVVVNDGSPDTPLLEAALEPYRDRIVYLTQTNQGPSAARNTAIRAARGEYVAFLDGDDLWEPEFLEFMLGKLRDQELDAIYCDTRLFGTTHRAGRTAMEFHPSGGACTLQAMVEGKVNIYTSTLLARKSAIVAAGLFDEEMRRSEDFDLWTRMSVNGARFGYDYAVLGRRRIHAGGLTANEAKMLQGACHALHKLLHNPALPPEIRPFVQRRHAEISEMANIRAARQALQAGDVQTALGLLRSARGSSAATNWKIRAADFVLSLAPALGPVAMRCWHSLLLWRHQFRAGRKLA